MFPLWMPPNGALHGAVVDRQMAISLACMAFLAVLAQIVALVALLRRPGNHARNFSIWNAVTFLAIAALFIGLALRTEKVWAANRFQGAAYDALQVEVVGQQFQWYFRYPGADAMFGTVRPELIDAAAGNPLGLDSKDAAGRDDFVSSKLVLPVGREVNLRVRSLDVVHGFSIPAMRVKQDAVPGSIFAIHFIPERLGVYDIVCSQVCGSGHYRMGAELDVVSPKDYAAWLAKHETSRETTR
jgi:cytochrome c oxidase subunit 2